MIFPSSSFARLVATGITLISLDVSAQEPADLLVRPDGGRLAEASEWPLQRAHFRKLAEEYIYGSTPDQPEKTSAKLLSTRSVFDGLAVQTLLILNIHRGRQTVPIRVGVLRPATETGCPIVIKNDRWLFDLSSMPAGRKRTQYANEGRDKTFQKVSRIAIERGYAICKFVREDFAEDSKESRRTGVLAMYPEHSWGAIAAWAWGYTPIIDYLLESHNVDFKRIIATGHSRGGKTALAAAIFDERIAISAPSASGSCGTGSMQHFTPGGRRQTCEEIFKNHSYWFSPRLGDLDSSQPLPIDGHVLRALVAPRGLINTQGIDDGLANPRGTRMMFDASEPVFALLGMKNRTATHWRPGGHGHMTEDWRALFDYADAYFAGQPLPQRLNNWPTNSQ